MRRMSDVVEVNVALLAAALDASRLAFESDGFGHVPLWAKRPRHGPPRAHVPQDRAPAGIAARRRVRVLLQRERDIHPAARRQFAEALGEIPGLQGQRAAVLLHQHLEVLLFPHRRRARDLDIHGGEQRRLIAVPERRQREHIVDGRFVDLAKLQHGVDVEARLEILGDSAARRRRR